MANDKLRLKYFNIMGKDNNNPDRIKANTIDKQDFIKKPITLHDDSTGITDLYNESIHDYT